MDRSELLDAARVGFAGLSASPSLQDAALDQLEIWLTDPHLSSYQAQLIALVEAERWQPLLDAFYRVLPFGTGGRRGRVGVGPNRFNPWTLATSVQGHANWLKETCTDGSIHVVLGYDVRVFQDLAKQLIPDVHAPIRGITSRNFAEIAAEVYAAAEISVSLPPIRTFISTPELSYAIRALQANGGLMISASHNAPDDNGSKFYHAHGGQLVPPYDEQMGSHIEGVTSLERMPLDRARATGLIRELSGTIHSGYIEANLACSRDREARRIHVVFTPLHGTGRTTVAEVLDQAGFKVDIEPTQANFDGGFSTVPHRAPNPELPATMDIARATADRLGADLVMATDPDADRLGVLVRHPRAELGVTDGWRFLTGNEIAALVCHYAINCGDHPQPTIFKTEVTSSLVSRVTETAGARIIGHLLVGFKYIGHALYAIEQTGGFSGLSLDLSDFVAGVEESHGVLVTTAIRDKDAAGGALLLAELAAQEKARGRTLVDTLHDLWRDVGVVENRLYSTLMLGAIGRNRIDRILMSMRADPPTRIGGLNVSKMMDHLDPDGPFGPIRSTTDAASRNMLVWHLSSSARVILRPSGTEPKCKVYVEVAQAPAPDVAEKQVAARIQLAEIGEDFVHQMLQRADISLPRWALNVNDLVPVERKVEFAKNILPQLLDRLNPDGPSAQTLLWLDQALGSSGRGDRSLYADAVDRYIETHQPEFAPALRSCFR